MLVESIKESITNECLSYVLDMRVVEIYPTVNSEYIEITITDLPTIDPYYVNIHSIANKCKIYAYDKGYEIVSLKSVMNDGKWVSDVYHEDIEDGDVKFLTDDEAISIFKATQWVYEKERNK